MKFFIIIFIIASLIKSDFSFSQQKLITDEEIKAKADAIAEKYLSNPNHAVIVLELFKKGISRVSGLIN